MEKPKLLIVEDDDLTQKLYRHLFAEKFEFKICKNAEEFCSELLLAPYDIFLIDLSLIGDKDGIQIIKELRQQEEYKLKPIIVVSANAYKRDEQIAREAGASMFFRKPINNTMLINEILNSLN